jgi:hypothetical protein
MKQKLIYLSIFCIFIINLASCKKYLDKKANTSFVVPSSVSDLQALLDDATIMNLNGTPIFEENSADDYFLVYADLSTLSTQNQKAYVWEPYDNVQFPNDWSYSYAAIYNANYCLEQIEKIDQNSNLLSWNNVKGSALFFRSYYLTHLVWTFAKAYDEASANTDLGIPLRLTSDFNVPSVRSSVQETYDKVINDAKESITYLPDNSSHPFRPSKAASYGLLARIYLSMRQYDSALKYSNLCLQIKNQLINLNGDPDIINSFSSTNPPFKQFNKETIFYTVMSNSYSTANPFRANIDTSLFQSYTNNDLRRVAYFKPNTAYPSYKLFKGSYTSATTAFTGIATDEMYLVRSECYARKGDITSALADLNTLLSKRYNATFIPVTATNANDALAKILEERRKELIFRDLRFIDIKRFNKEGANITLKRIVNGQLFTILPNDNRYALPIPQEIINQSGMPQNAY